MRLRTFFLTPLLLLAGITTVAVADEPLACNMSALTKQERERYGVLSQKLAKAVVSQTELADGYAFSLRNMPLAEVAEWVAFESRCCPFLNFGIELPSRSETLKLRLTGGKGVKEFLVAELGLTR